MRFYWEAWTKETKSMGCVSCHGRGRFSGLLPHDPRPKARVLGVWPAVTQGPALEGPCPWFDAVLPPFCTEPGKLCRQSCFYLTKGVKIISEYEQDRKGGVRDSPPEIPHINTNSVQVNRILWQYLGSNWVPGKDLDLDWKSCLSQKHHDTRYKSPKLVTGVIRLAG